MNDTTFKAFGDEFTKIAFFQKLRNGFVNAMKDGWHGTPEQIRAGDGQNWMGRSDRISRMNGWQGNSLKGLREEAAGALPIGGKSIMLLGTGLMAGQALRKQDPSGQNRSRTERVTGLAANTVGGLAGGGLASRMFPKSRLLAPLVGSVVGGMGAENAVTTPFAAMRHRQMGMQPQQPMAQPVSPQGVRE